MDDDDDKMFYDPEACLCLNVPEHDYVNVLRTRPRV